MCQKRCLKQKENNHGIEDMKAITYHLEEIMPSLLCLLSDNQHRCMMRIDVQSLLDSQKSFGYHQKKVICNKQIEISCRQK